MKPTQRQKRPVWPAAVLLALACGLAPPLLAQEGLPGDVNLDGAINVLDVQASINIALGQETQTAEADVDEDGTVFVTDIQVITNTALGVSGLIQPVSGTLNLDELKGFDGPFTVVAVSEDGRVETARANPETGVFRLRLPVRTAWSFGFMHAADTEPETVGTVRFRLTEGASTLLPLLRISRGAPLDLGVLSPSFLTEPSEDMRRLLGAIGDPLDDTDFDEDGLADVLESLLLPLPTDPGDFGFDDPQLVEIAGIINEELEELVIDGLLDCVEDEIDEFLDGPDLTGIENGGFPHFLGPLILCFYTAVEEELIHELDEEDFGDLAAYVPAYVDFLTFWFLFRLDEWFLEVNDPDLIDLNNNGIPDYIEGDLCLGDGTLPGVPSNLEGCAIDDDTDGVPDFAEDEDNDIRPNLFDLDARTPDDLDADGIENDRDIDDDSDGVPDYADAAPGDARRS